MALLPTITKGIPAMNFNRRKLITGAVKTSVALGMTPALSGCGGSDAKKIDVHHHAVPALYLDALAQIGIHGSGGIPFPKWTPEKSFNVMAFNKITSAVLSLSSPGTYFGDEDFAVRLARDVNEYLADVVQSHPDKFGFFATLPMPL